MSNRDLYEILGVSRKATPEEIKRAYRKLAKKYHPDHNPDDPGAEQRFKEVQHAYSVLNDEKKRAQYDRFGEIGAGDFRTSPGGQQVYTWGPGGQQINVEDLESLFSAFGGEASASPFERFFRQAGGGRRRRQRPVPMRGQDVRRRINLAFEQAITGLTIEVDVHPRSASGGKSETLEVKIPPGVEDGQPIRLKGKGAPGAGGGPPGDLFLICSVRPHERFRREGRDLVIDLSVSMPEAALGAKVEVPTLDGPVTMTIPPGTSSGTRLRLQGRGVPAHGSTPAGNQYVILQVKVPKTLSEEQKRLMEAFGATLNGGSGAKKDE